MKLYRRWGVARISTVYLTQHTVTKRHVATKVFHQELVSTLINYSNFEQRFEQEMQTVIGLDHPHIVKLFDHGQQEHYQFVIREFMSGSNLADRLRNGMFSLPMVVRIVDQIASALDYCHERDLIHRKLNPRKILFDNQGNARLADVGMIIVNDILFELYELYSGKMIWDVSTRPVWPDYLAHYHYMTPEAWRGEPMDARTDIYGLGVLTFEMLTGQVPFVGDNPFEVLRKTCYQAPPSVASLRSDISSSVADVIQKVMATNKVDRFPSAGQFAAALRLTALGSI